ncbi:MAG: hypothetical protein J7M14_03725, partial [Planctomycetes bacterium]|nr:hypothetical protein [Planctomycetota bacterium]
VWKIARPGTKVVHWCFDMYPEAAIAEGMIKPAGIAARVLKRMLKFAYGACDLIVDIGPCMRRRLRHYSKTVRMVTLPPWALVEPSAALVTDKQERHKVFGDTQLAVSYSGNFGRAHSYEMFLKLARRLRGEDIAFAFSLGGNFADEVRRAVSPEDSNIAFVPFAPMERLEQRLGASDIHLVSLKERWTGAVVPSKFFGSLAVGRPVVFVGSADSAPARWIALHKVGWVLSEDTLDSLSEEFKRLSRSPQELRSLQRHCHSVYRENFSRKHVADAWDAELRGLIGAT